MLSNQFSIIIGIISLIFTSLFVARGHFVPYPIMAMVLISLLIFGLNKAGFTSLSRVIVGLAPLFSILALNIFSKMEAPERIESIHYVSARLLIVASLALPMTLFTTQEKKFSIFSVSLILFVGFFFDSINEFFGVGSEDLGIVSNYKATVMEDLVLMVVILLGSFLFLINMNSKYGEINKKLLEEAQAQNRALNEREIELKRSLGEVEKSREDEENRNWITKGVAEFSKLLRRDFAIQDDLYRELISSIVNYLSAMQGGMYVVEEKGGEKVLELVACYAYDRQKFADQTIRFGEGLVGQSWMEKEVIFLTDVPAGYTHISSGLGASNPRSICIFPLLASDECVGVIEIASLQFLEKHHVEFLERLSENIASVMISQQMGNRTKKLLEESQQLSEHLKEKEKELAESLRVAQKEQEEMKRKEKELIQQITDLQKSS